MELKKENDDYTYNETKLWSHTYNFYFCVKGKTLVTVIDTLFSLYQSDKDYWIVQQNGIF